MLKRFYAIFLAPSAEGDDARRQESILDTLLFGSCGLATIGLAISMFEAPPRTGTYLKSPPFMVFTMLAGLAILYVLSRYGHYRQSAYMLLAIIFLFATYALLIWGIQLPQGILIYSLIIIMAGVFLNRKFALAITLLLFVTLLSLTALKDEHVIKVTSSWGHYAGTYIDAGVYGATFILIALMAWLSNRETAASLRRARDSENQLRIERNRLEIKVMERTRELERSQTEKVNELQRFAEFGLLSSTLLHDLANPLTSVSIELEQLANSEHARLVKRAREGIGSMERYITAARERLRNETRETDFNTARQIETVTRCLAALARTQQVAVCLAVDQDIRLYGNNASFDQIVSNLLVNGIDAYRGTGAAPPREVWVRTRRQRNSLILEVEDKGMGIDRKDLARVLDPFYTTKPPQYGSGLGLSITRRAVEKDFGGTLKISSEIGVGTCVTVSLPQR